jgi:hypothetical protein
MGTAGSLIEAVRKNGTKSSVFLQEQTATLLANMAAVPEARPHMAANHAVIALLCFLQVRHSPLQRVPEILAAERLQHKTAIALSRYYIFIFLFIAAIEPEQYYVTRNIRQNVIDFI